MGLRAGEVGAVYYNRILIVTEFNITGLDCIITSNHSLFFLRHSFPKRSKIVKAVEDYVSGKNMLRTNLAIGTPIVEQRVHFLRIVYHSLIVVITNREDTHSVLIHGKKAAIHDGHLQKTSPTNDNVKKAPPP